MQKMTIQEIEQEILKMKPRFFDVYILPSILVYFSLSKKGKTKNRNRILFVSGVYMFLRNYGNYKSKYIELKKAVENG